MVFMGSNQLTGHPRRQCLNGCGTKSKGYRLPILRWITDKVRESSQRSKKRSFEWIWTQIAEEFRDRRHGMNYENVVKGLVAHPLTNWRYLPATGGEQSSKAPKISKTKGSQEDCGSNSCSACSSRTIGGSSACQDQGPVRVTRSRVLQVQ